MMQSKFIPEYDIKLVGDCKVVAISEKGVEVEDRNWNHRFLDVYKRQPLRWGLPAWPWARVL